MDYFLLIVALVFAALAVRRILAKRRENAGTAVAAEPAAPKRRNRFDPKIENAGPGGVIKLTAVGPDMRDLDAHVLSRHLYREGDYEWFELECETAEGKLWIDVEEDDGVQVSVSLRTLDLEETGLSPGELENIAKAKRGSCIFEGQFYRLRETGKALFYRDGDLSRGERIRYWDFATSDGYRQLGFEQWGETEYQVHLGQPIRPHQITVYAERDETR